MGFLTTLTAGIWGYVGAAALALSIGAFGGYKVTSWHDTQAVANRDVAIAGYQRDIAIDKANALTFQNAAQTCSASIAEVQAETDKVTKASQDALAVARSKGDGLTKEISRLEALKPGPDTCLSADEFILENAR